MNLKSIWSVLEESSEILFGNYAYPAADKATEAGKQVRAEVEAETERLFFAPWSCLNESELEELASLASQLLDGLRALIK